MSRYARGAAILGQNPLFREFVTTTTGRPVPDAEAAAAEVREACGVLSRKQLDASVEAGRRYLLLVEQFNEWLGRRHGSPRA